MYGLYHIIIWDERKYFLNYINYFAINESLYVLAFAPANSGKVNLIWVIYSALKMSTLTYTIKLKTNQGFCKVTK